MCIRLVGACFYLALAALVTSGAIAAPQTAAVSQGAKQARGYVAQGDAAFARHDFGAAAQAYAAARRLEPANPRANLALGNLALLQGDCIDAVKYLGDARRADVKLAEADGLIGICEKREGNAAARGHLAAAYPRIKNSLIRTEVGVELANLYYNQGDLDLAAPILQSLIATNPDNADILFFAHQVYQDLADETLNKLATQAPDSARMQQAMAERLVNNGDLPHAIEHYRAALKIDPNLPGAHFELGEALFDAAPSSPEARNEAEKELQAAERIDGESAALEDELGYIAAHDGDATSALQHYQAAQRANPRDDQAQLGVARTLMQQQKYEEALPLLRKAVSESPLDGEAHYRLSLALRATGDKAGAERELALFRQIKAAQGKIRALYQQMSQKPPAAAADETPE